MVAALERERRNGWSDGAIIDWERPLNSGVFDAAVTPPGTLRSQSSNMYIQ